MWLDSLGGQVGMIYGAGFGATPDIPGFLRRGGLHPLSLGRDLGLVLLLRSHLLSGEGFRITRRPLAFDAGAPVDVVGKDQVVVEKHDYIPTGRVSFVLESWTGDAVDLSVGNWLALEL